MSLSFQYPWVLILLLSLLPLVRSWSTRPTSLTPRRRRGALWLRVLAVTCVVLALAGARVVTMTRDLTVMFLLDRSLSTGGDSQRWQREFMASALTARGITDQFGAVLFGKESRVELAAGPHQKEQMGPFSQVVDRNSSNLTSALRFAASTFPAHTARRLVILSDGQSTEAETEAEVQALAAAGIEVWTVPLPDNETPDLLVSRVEAPSQVAIDEPFALRVVVESSGIGEAKLLLTENGTPRQTVNLKLREGPNLFLLPQRVNRAGPVRFEARVSSPTDKRPENNKGETLLVVGQEQTVLVLRSEQGPGSLVPLLEAAGIRAMPVTPGSLPRRVGAWRDVSALVIEDVDALSWSLELQKVVSLLVRDGGMGLLMLGSDSTFGVGGYQHTAIEPLLPVNLAIRRPKDQPLAALVQCLDKSGSMSGEPIRKAREACISAGSTLSERDLLGVVAFDSAARWIFRFQAKGDGEDFRDRVSRLRAGGGTDLYPALSQAIDELQAAEAMLKHIIVLSDGAVGAADYHDLAMKAVGQKITISAIALGPGADVTFLRELTRKGKGRLYEVRETSAGTPLPQVFIRETLLATGAGVSEKPTEIRPTESAAGSPILEGLEFAQTPALLGHNMASVKGGTAKTLLATPKQDPILAVGRAGLGKTAAWTSDLGGEWAASWLGVPSGAGGSLLEAILLRTMRSINTSGSLSERARGDHLEVRSQSSGDLSSLEVTMRSRTPLKGPVTAVVVNRNGESHEVILQPEGPFLARGVTQVTEAGSALVFAHDPDGQLLARANLSVPLAPEFARLGTNRELLRSLAESSGGRFEARAEDVFLPPEKPFPIPTPLAHDLARGALLLLLLEIAVRRLPLPKRVTDASQVIQSSPEVLSERMARLRETKKTTTSKREETGLNFTRPKVERLQKAPPPTARTTLTAKPEKRETSPPPSAPASSTLSRLKKVKKKKQQE